MMPSTIFCDNCGTANKSQARLCRFCGNVLQVVAQTIDNSTTGQLLPDVELGQRYRIIEPVGKGGFGAVYKAEDTQSGNRLVAIKEMSQNGLSVQEQREAAEAFKQEAIMLAHLQYPNLPRIFKHFEENRRWYLVMEFIEGETLESYLNKQPDGTLPLDKTIDIGIQLCTVLDYLHNQQPPIIFRDLKPANVMRKSDGQICLIDFGIARFFKPGQTRDTLALGSPGYAAPEQHGKAQTTPRADIYSLGAVLHQLLSGHDPSSSPFRFPPLQSLVPTVPTNLATFITQMLDMDESKRPANMLLVKQTLQSFKPNLFAPPLPSPQPKPYSRKPFGPVGTLLFRYAEHTGTIRAVKWSSDGTRIATTCNDSTVQVWSLDSDRQPPFTKNLSSKVLSIVWSPDGKRIAFADENRTLQVWNSDGSGQPLIFQGILEFHTYSIAWSPDSTQIAFPAKDETVQVISLPGGQTVTYKSHSLWSRNREGHFFLSVWWSPDGKRIAAVSDDGIVQIWHMDGRREHFTYKEKYNNFSLAAWSPDGTSIAFVNYHQIKLWNFYKNEKFVIKYEEIRDYNGLEKSGRGTSESRYNQQSILALSWSPDGKCIAFAATDGTARVWNADGSGQPLIYNDLYYNSIPSLAWSPDGKHIAFPFGHGYRGSNDVRIWYPGDDEALIYRSHSNFGQAVAWSPDGKRIASSSQPVGWHHDERVHVWNAADTFIDGSDSRITWSFAQLADGAHIASASDSRKVHFWDADGSKQPFIYNYSTPSRYNVSMTSDSDVSHYHAQHVSPNSKRVASANGTTVLVANADQSGRSFSYTHHAGAVLGITWSPDSTRIASISQDGAIHVWNINGSGRPFVYRGHAASLQSLAWSPDGIRIVSASKAGEDAVHVWNADGSGRPFIYKGHNYHSWGIFVTSVAWSSDGTRIASSTSGAPDAPNSISKVVHVWNADGSGQPFIYKGHDDGVVLLDWSPDGTRIVSTDEAGVVLVWSAG